MQRCSRTADIEWDVSKNVKRLHLYMRPIIKGRISHKDAILSLRLGGTLKGLKPEFYWGRSPRSISTRSRSTTPRWLTREEHVMTSLFIGLILAFSTVAVVRNWAHAATGSRSTGTSQTIRRRLS